MDELALRRKRLFSGSATAKQSRRQGAKPPGGKFSSVILHSGDSPGAPSASFSYFAGFELDGCYLILGRKGGIVLAHRMNERAASKLSAYPVKQYGKKPVQEIRRMCGGGSVGYSSSEMPAKRFLALRKTSFLRSKRREARLKLVDADEKMLAVRAVKSVPELRALAASAKMARGILSNLKPWKCRTEKELEQHLRMAALKKGADVSFPPIVATDENAAQPHHSPTGKKLGSMVLVDFGVKLDGYCSDFTMCYFRKKGSKEEKAYKKCIAAFGEIVKGLDGCKNGKEAALLSEKVLAAVGLPKLIHSIGHGIGLEVHENPRLARVSKDLLAGAVLAIEPAAYFKKFGVRHEEMIVRAKGRWRRL